MGGELVGETKTRILIVEDNSDDEILLMRQLEKAGLASKVQVIDDGQRALSYLFSDEHDLVAVFLDLSCSSPSYDPLVVVRSRLAFSSG
jgi:CheY-like chemotaxis protein